MEIIVIIGLIILLVIYLLAQDSKKDTARERYGEAVGQLAQITADKISSIANTITEPKDKKIIRLAEEDLASRNGQLYRFDYYSNKDYLKRLLTIDEQFKKTLNTLELSENKWDTIAHKLLYIGTIRQLSRDPSDYSKKKEKFIRENMINDWINDPILKDDIQMLYTALNYFGIDISEWVEYGDTVIEMHNLYDDPDIRKYGIITSIKPMKNNRQLL